jgi:hypothetical protein
MDILDSFGDFVQLIITIIVAVVGIKVLISTTGSNSLVSIIGVPFVAVWIFFDYDIYLGMIIGSLIILFGLGEDEDEKLVAIILLILTILKFGYFGFIR